MSVDPQHDAARRSVVPEAAGRSLWLAAIWTGVGAAVVCATVAIVVVAVCWLPVSGTSGHTRSAIHAGLLSFLAALHGGVTVGGSAAAFLPLGMMIIVGLACWRAGSGLADAANSLGEGGPARLWLAGALQSASFMAACLAAVPVATLGTSSAPFGGVAVASAALFAVSGGIAFVRSSALADVLADVVPAATGPVLRAAAAAVTVYLAVGAALVAGSLAVHAERVEALSREVGGGWSSVPILVLGVLAAPNAAIAGAAYLAGPGFAVGAGTTASAVSTAHGTLPAFPILAAMPTGHGASTTVWWLIAITPVAGGLAMTRLACRGGRWITRAARTVAAAAVAGAGMGVLAWQGGGAIGDGALHTIGASPWRTGLYVTLEVGGVAVVALAVVLAGQGLRAMRGGGGRPVARLVRTAGAADEPDRTAKLAG